MGRKEQTQSAMIEDAAYDIKLTAEMMKDFSDQEDRVVMCINHIYELLDRLARITWRS